MDKVEWVSVKDTYPQKDVDVLVAHRGDRFYRTLVAWYNGEAWRTLFEIIEINEDDFWMCLPEPPRESEQ